MSLLHCFLPLFVFGPHLLGCVTSFCLEDLNLLLEIGDNIAMVLYDLLLLIAELLLELDDFLIYLM